MSVFNPWRRFINIGITEHLSFAEAKKIRLLNGLSLIFVLAVCFYIGFFVVVNFYTQERAINNLLFIAFSNLTLCSLVLSIPYLNYRQWYLGARIVSILILLIPYTAFSVFSEKPFLNENLMFVIAAFVFIMFDNIKWLILFFSLVVICYVIIILIVAKTDLIYYAYVFKYSFLMRVLFVFLILFLCFNMFRLEHLRYQQEIEAKNLLLSQRTDQLEQLAEEMSQQNDKLRQHEVLLEKQNTQLTSLNHSKDKLFSIIGHDLRSPIANLKMVMEIMDSDDMNATSFRLFTQNLKANTNAVYQTLDNLLQWSQNQLRGITTTPAAIDMYAIVEEKKQLFSEIARGKNIEIINQIPQNTIAYADKEQVRLVLRNLLGNALKFTHQGGKIVVTGKETETEMEFSVADSGMGMSQETIDKLFIINALFTQRGTEGEKGSGLGLLLVKEFLESNHGRIWVESTQGKGSVFRFCLQKINS